MNMEWALNSVTGVLTEEGRDTEKTQRRGPCEDGGRDWRDVSTSQGIPSDQRPSEAGREV